MEWHYDAWLDGEKAVSSNECVAAPIGDELMPVTKRFKRKASQLQVEQEIAPAPKKSKKSPDPKGEQKKEKTFACRAVPTGAVGYARFSAIKKAFQDHLQLYLEHPSKYQDCVYGRVDLFVCTVLSVCSRVFESRYHHVVNCQDPFYKDCQPPSRSISATRQR